MSRVRLFVYGSLKRGGLHHHELKGAEFLGEARTVPGYALEPWGQYLALVAAPGRQDCVTGELFELAEELLPVLDEFEGDAYFRGEVALADRNDGAALAYFGKAR